MRICRGPKAVAQAAFVLMTACVAFAWQQERGSDLKWAFPSPDKDAPKSRDSGEPKHIPGSTLSFTQTQIDGDPFNPPDWLPNEHPKMPDVVAHGRRPAQACARCHLANGNGHPESATLTGLDADYLIRQTYLFKSGVRKDYASAMNAFAKAMTDQDVKEAAEYFATLKPEVFYKVVEASTVPRTYIDDKYMRLPHPSGGMEPLGKRIISVPQDAERTESRDPHSGFIAYVPPGSIKRGESLVKGGGGKTVACAICHGSGLKGLGEVPRLAGQHPIFIARQLYKFQDGRNGGKWAELMKAPVAKLTGDDIIVISAYIGSLAP
jgi:cytochrome c553